MVGKGRALQGFIKHAVGGLIREVEGSGAQRAARSGAKGAERAGKQGAERAGRESAERSGTKASKPGVKEHEVDSYKGLNNRANTGDGLQHDHIPSAAALERAEKKRLGRPLTKSEKRQVKNNGTTVAVTDADHAKSRTYKGRNTPEQIEADASDLSAAQSRDLDTMESTMRENGYSPERIKQTMDRIRAHNRERGIG